MIRRLIYRQMAGGGRGGLVEILSETTKSLHLKDLKTEFEFDISIRSFQIGYERADDYKDEKC